MMLTGLDRVLRGANVRYREVPGWKSRTGRRAGVQLPKAILWHHTATPAATIKAKNNPTTKYMTDGLGYPLAQLGLAWDGTVDIIAAGWCAHAGKGAYPGIPTNQGNEYAIGIEVEGTIGLRWSDAQLETAARLGAAFDREFGQLVHIGHYEWAPGRKTDPSGIPGNMPALRSAIKRGGWNTVAPVASVTPIATPAPAPKEDTLSAAEVAEIKAHIDAKVASLPRETAHEVWIRSDPSTGTVHNAFRLLVNTHASSGSSFRLDQKTAEKLASLQTLASAPGVTAVQFRDAFREALNGAILTTIKDI